MNILYKVCSLIFISLFLSVYAAQPAKPSVAASSYLLIDYETGQVLLEENSQKQLAPASLTKMMTSYIIASELAKGNINKDDNVLISENAWAQNPKLKGGSLMFIEVNKYVSVGDLHKGIIIQSGNDASIAMAEHIAGSEDAFADLMNQHAQRLGMNDSYFINSTGLPAQGQVTTAHDLAKLAHALIKDFPEEYGLYSEKEFTFNNIVQKNRNELLNDKGLGVDGIKTGHTEEAGYCLVSSAEKDGMRLIAVVMGTDSKAARASESRKLLNHGFRFYTTIKAFSAAQSLKNVQIWKGEKEAFSVGLAQDAMITVLKREKDQLEANYIVNKQIIAPVRKGQIVGEVYFKVGDKEIKRMPMIALENVAEAGFFGRLWDSVKLWFED